MFRILGLQTVTTGSVEQMWHMISIESIATWVLLKVLLVPYQGSFMDIS